MTTSRITPPPPRKYAYSAVLSHYPRLPSAFRSVASQKNRKKKKSRKLY
jgi:hypothetical protein